MSTSFTIANIAGGDERTFRLVDGCMSDAALRHARSIGYGGPAFGGPAAEEAQADFDRQEEYRLNGQ